MTEDPREKILAFGTAISEGAADIPGLDHWRSLPIAQAPSWADEADHRAAVAELSALPPLVFAGEVDLLRARLADVARAARSSCRAATAPRRSPAPPPSRSATASRPCCRWQSF